MTAVGPYQLLKLSNPNISEDGTSIYFVMETTGGDETIAIPTQDIGKIMQFFASLALYVDGTTAMGDGHPLPDVKNISPIPIGGIGFATGVNNAPLLILGFGEFALAFEMTAKQLLSAAHKFSSLAHTLSAEGSLN